MTAYDQGVPSLRVAVYPGPFDLHSDSELRANAAKIVVPQVIEALTKPLPESASAPESSLKEQKDREIVFTGTIDEINRYFSDYQWSDGMAIIPPTMGRVDEFLKYTGYAPHEEIAVLPLANLRGAQLHNKVQAEAALKRALQMVLHLAG